ncbi:hypothetical protein HYFRA_00005481 [Hymenoscyphus fraxineus]|uniref:Uncharacterized protein n=1 Tax=Hymenoscyphus fraxineus TaxID=746836 RepID=A0A9N9PLY0_9HELO|nr:hypothetical protein HYFRA_00005481 [Hymenoscyphus fraxineus]
MGDSVVEDFAFNFINSAFKLSDHAGRVHESESDSGAFEGTIEGVRHDLTEVERLLVLDSVKRGLMNAPGRLSYIQNIVVNAKKTLQEIETMKDSTRSEKGGIRRMSFENRSRWIFNDHGKLVNQELQLSTCQQDLSSLLALLIALDQTHSTTAQISSTKQLETLEPEVSMSLDDLISPWQRRKMTREAGKGSKELYRDSTKEAPLPVPASSTESSLHRRPLRVPRKKVGSGLGSPKEVAPPLPPRAVKSNPEVSQTTMNHSNYRRTSRGSEASESSNPTSSESSEISRPSISISSMSSGMYSPERKTLSLSTISDRDDSPDITEVIQPHTHSLNSSNIIPTPASKPASSMIQPWTSQETNSDLRKTQEERTSRPRPFHLLNKTSLHPKILSIGYPPVSSPSKSPEIAKLPTPSSRSHARNHSASLTTLPVPSYPSLRQRSLSATNLLGPINPFEYMPENEPSSSGPDQNNTTASLQDPAQKSIRSESVSGSQQDRNSATELLRAQSKRRHSLEMPKRPLMKPKSFNRAMELPTGFLSWKTVSTSPPIQNSLAKTMNIEERDNSGLTTSEDHKAIESSQNPPPEVVDTAYLFKTPHPSARPPNLVEQNYLNKHAMSWPVIPKNAHELPSNERPTSVMFTNQLQFQTPTPAETSFMPDGKGWDLRIPDFNGGRMKTVAEGRRRNRRALMDLMERGSYG